ncbi:MAG: hypothetical protein HYW86_02015 [Candidatus Roizmanbacteria bacterium]|nr:MAG: hypothetical protein HYW86_02015 [Candidatus Roizmanbacteria bacterium]
MVTYILTKELAQKALAMIRPSIEAILGTELVGGRKDFYIAVFDLGTDDILADDVYGDRPRWEYPYDKIAGSKGTIATRTGLTTRDVQVNAPWLYQKSDTRYVGSVTEHGLVVAGSGLANHWDETIGWWVLSAIQGLCREFIAKIDDDTAPDFFE